MKTRFWILIGLVIASLGAMVYITGGTRKSSVILADATAVIAAPSQYSDHELRVRGFVKPSSVVRYGDKADFIMTLDGKDLKVHFDGSTQLPDTFADNAPVRADGHLSPENSNLLIANKVEAKCASKYEADYAKRRDSSGIHPAGYAGDRIQ